MFSTDQNYGIRFSPSNTSAQNGIPLNAFNPSIYFSQFRRSSNEFEENSPELNPNKYNNGNNNNGNNGNNGNRNSGGPLDKSNIPNGITNNGMGNNI